MEATGFSEILAFVYKITQKRSQIIINKDYSVGLKEGGI
jgi:hypothetical protein